MNRYDLNREHFQILHWAIKILTMANGFNLWLLQIYNHLCVRDTILFAVFSNVLLFSIHGF